MNSLWIRGMPILSSCDHNYECNTCYKPCKINHTPIDCCGCPSHVYFGDSPYTLGFGHLFSGNLHNYQTFNPIQQCCKSCSFGKPYTPQMNNIQCGQEPIINLKIDEAMKNIRQMKQNIEKQCNYSVPSVPCKCNPLLDNCNYNNITKAATLLERAANAMSIAANTQNHCRR